MVITVEPYFLAMKQSIVLLTACVLGLLIQGCSPAESSRPERNSQTVKVGAEVLLEKHLDELQGKRVGLVMNPTARVNGTHMLDTLLKRSVNVSALFAPEHGFRGEAGAGEVIEDGVDRETGLPVYSLYGETKKPTPEMLKDVDVLLFDMQDVGGRFYTYNVTLGLVLEAASQSEVPVWVLDRPNPAGGSYISGWLLDQQYKSFVGAYPVPMAHGMTLGELAKMMIGERWLRVVKQPKLRVIPAEGWERDMKWPNTGLEWHPPSPNLPTFEHAFAYLGTVLFEGTNISEGRGTSDPFLKIGAPFLNLQEDKLAKLQENFPGVNIQQITFTPVSIPGKARNPKYEGQSCRGVKIVVSNYDTFDPVLFGVRLLKLMDEASEQVEIDDFIFKLAGSEAIQNYNTGVWQGQIDTFREARKPYLIYD